jgi:hypothetical protein
VKSFPNNTATAFIFFAGLLFSSLDRYYSGLLIRPVLARFGHENPPSLWPDSIVPTDCILKLPKGGSALATGEKPTTNLTRLHADVLKMRWEVCAQAKQWALGFEIANDLAAKRPRDSFGVIHAAYALCQLKRTQAAHDLLSGVVEEFPKDQAIRYDLACYCCQLGKLKEAMDHLERAIVTLWAKIGEV